MGAIHFRLAAAALMRGMGWRARWRIVVFVFPVLCLAAAALLALEALVYQVRSERVTGTVVERYAWPGETIFDRGRINYEPVFTYSMNGGAYRASVGSGHSSFDLDIGETAAIRAIPGHRGNVRIDSFAGMWFVPAVVAAIGAAALGLAALVWSGLTRIFWRGTGG
ncbi:hypothetical protein [Histidinibacterium lentulum]|uniref:DUF3592 domain-containing protein n=1 Tax=Histidinibacterium lentulum TaxID=2480588 RepID=A0A3N2RA68_9RHOB|nr:hypothetical protein [Histidinibacterium lentulum]ROU04313.1 hypothetical protein EAT49_02680 [Histidinibacterium lentulum]